MIRHALRAALLLALAPVAAHAQGAVQQPIELGIDGGLTFGLSSPHYTLVTIPGQRLRVGLFSRENLSIEPSIMLIYVHQGGGSSSQLGADVGVLYHFPTTAGGSRVYLRPFAGLNYASFSSGSSDDSNAQFHLGGGIGTKIPLVDRLRLRLEANIEHGFKNDDASGGTALGLLAGFSFFTH